MPKIVYILRHGEKPTAAGDVHLAPKGYQRAGALAALFDAKHNGGVYPPIDALCAAADTDESHRPRLTIEPLSGVLGRKIDLRYKDKQFATLADELLGKKYDGKILLVAWHHGEIPALAGALNAKDVPAKWPEDRFDLIWQLAFDGSTTPKLTILPQLLLYGDKAV